MMRNYKRGYSSIKNSNIDSKTIFAFITLCGTLYSTHIQTESASKVGKIDDKINEICVNSAKMEGKVDNLSTNYSKMEGKINGISVNNAKMEGTINGISVNNAKMEEKINSISDSIMRKSWF
jgi:peptidoglycan hydrolase CwlO-like protein